MTTTYHIADIRNVALAGHGASGKTTLADALLFTSGAINRKGSVDDGTSSLDVDEEEKRRHFTIDCHLGHLAWAGKQVHLIDTPGYPDFIGSALERPCGRRKRGRRGLRPVRRRGQHPARLSGSRPARPGPLRRRHQDGRRKRRLPKRPGGDPRDIRHALRAVQRPGRPGHLVCRASSMSSSRTTKTPPPARWPPPKPIAWSSSKSSSSMKTS